MNKEAEQNQIIGVELKSKKKVIEKELRKEIIIWNEKSVEEYKDWIEKVGEVIPP